MLVAFPDGSSAEYQVTGINPLTFSFVLGSGHATNGEPENDSGELVSTSPYNAVTSPTEFSVKQQIAQTISQEQKTDSWEIGPQNLGQAGLSTSPTITGSVEGALTLNDMTWSDWDMLTKSTKTG